MCCKLNLKKSLSILLPITITLVSMSSAGFATVDCETSIGTSAIGVSGDPYETKEQLLNISNESLNSSMNSSMNSSLNSSLSKKNSKFKVIDLNTPGNYRLVGANTKISDEQDANTILVNPGDSISIKGCGKYNKYDVILDNVNINIDKKVENHCICPLKIRGGANVTLLLRGNNSLKSSSECNESINLDHTSRLTVVEESKGSSLDISEYRQVTKNSHSKELNEKNTSGCLVIESGEVKVSKLDGENIIVNGGNVDVNDICVRKNFEINGGNVNACQISNPANDGVDGTMIVNGGSVSINQTENESDSDGIHLTEIKVNGGIINATEITGGKLITINNGNLQAKRKIYSENMVVNKGTVGSAMLHVNNLNICGGICEIYQIYKSNIVVNKGCIKADILQGNNQLKIDGGVCEISKIYNSNIAISKGIMKASVLYEVKRLKIDGGTFEVNEIYNSNVVVNNGDMIVNYINSNKLESCNFKKVFGLCDNKGKLISYSKNKINEKYKTGYLSIIENKVSGDVYFYITGGNIRSSESVLTII